MGYERKWIDANDEVLDEEFSILGKIFCGALFFSVPFIMVFLRGK